MRPTLQRGWTRALKEDPGWRSARDRRGAPRHRAVTALAAHAPSPVAGLSIGPPLPGPAVLAVGRADWRVTDRLPTQACTRCHCGPSEPLKHFIPWSDAYGTRVKAKRNKTPSHKALKSKHFRQ